MINFSEGLSFEQYLQKSSEEQRNEQKQAFERTHLSRSAVEKIQSLKETINVVIYSEGFCPDCVVTLPFIKRMEEINENIKVTILPLKGNEEKLKEFVGTARIPTVLAFSSSMEPKGAYVEVPKKLAERMESLSLEQKKDLIMEYRQGKYNEFIEKELIDILT